MSVAPPLPPNPSASRRPSAIPARLVVPVKIVSIVAAIYLFIVGVSGMGEAFKTSDVERSRAVRTGYKEELSAICEGVIERLVSGEVEELGASKAAAIALYVRHLKRIGAHSRNIMTSVVNPFHRIGSREKGADAGE